MAPVTRSRGLRGRLSAERGAELVEFALAMPILLVVLAGILDMGFLFKNYEVVTNAAREGARMAALPGWAEGDVVARVNTYLKAGGYQGTATTVVENVTLATAAGRSINGVRVRVSCPHALMMLGPILKLISAADLSNTTLHASATMRVEMAAGL
jgi:hypothetical protein